MGYFCWPVCLSVAFGNAYLCNWKGSVYFYSIPHSWKLCIDICFVYLLIVKDRPKSPGWYYWFSWNMFHELSLSFGSGYLIKEVVRFLMWNMLLLVRYIKRGVWLLDHIIALNLFFSIRQCYNLSSNIGTIALSCYFDWLLNNTYVASL